MICERCGGRGYLEDYYHSGARAQPMIRQCCDIAAYSRRVQELRNSYEAVRTGVGQYDVSFENPPPKPSKENQEPCPVIHLPKRD